MMNARAWFHCALLWISLDITSNVLAVDAGTDPRAVGAAVRVTLNPSQTLGSATPSVI